MQDLKHRVGHFETCRPKSSLTTQLVERVPETAADAIRTVTVTGDVTDVCMASGVKVASVCHCVAIRREDVRAAGGLAREDVGCSERVDLQRQPSTAWHKGLEHEKVEESRHELQRSNVEPLTDVPEAVERHVPIVSVHEATQTGWVGIGGGIGGGYPEEGRRVVKERGVGEASGYDGTPMQREEREPMKKLLLHEE